MWLVLSVVSIVVGVAIIVGAIVGSFRRGSAKPVRGPGPAAAPPRPGVAFAAEVPDAADDVPDEVSVPEAVPSPSWPERVHRANDVLDDEARLRLIKDLGMLRAAWCVPILEQAAEEESNPELHAAALAALAKCRRLNTPN